MALLGPDSAWLQQAIEEMTGTVPDPAAPLREHLHSLRQSIPRDPNNLRREHVRMFLDPAGAPCPPWQSAHGHPPRLMEDSHHRALAWYREEGLEPHRGNEPADHAGHLLFFYARLLESDGDPERLARFRSDHLDWMMPWLESVRNQTRLPFYVHTAELKLTLLRDVAPEGSAGES